MACRWTRTGNEFPLQSSVDEGIPMKRLHNPAFEILRLYPLYPYGAWGLGPIQSMTHRSIRFFDAELP